MPSLTLQPADNLKDGQVTYTIDGDTLNFSGFADVKIAWFTKRFTVNGSFTGTPGQFQKKNWQATGPAQSFPEGVTLQVISVDGAGAHVQVTDPQYNLSAIATVDVSGDPASNVEVLLVEGQVTVFGQTKSFKASA
jgi:hypothetical protein